jgi:rhamnulokinase
MTQPFSYLAFDLGAESGRALLGQYQSRQLTVEEVCRFPNDPVVYNGELHWDVPRLWFEMQNALASIGPRISTPLSGIGVDTWGLDYALLGEGGTLLENPYHYRDTQTDGMMDRVFGIIPPDEIYSRTGIQFMQVNGLYRLYTQNVRTPKLLRAAEKIFTIPDLFNFWLTGVAVAEFTNATTTQFYDPRKGNWSTEILEKLGIPTHFLVTVVQPGTILGGLRGELSRKTGLTSVPVIAPACHDTGSAVAAIAHANESAFISSGTWSLLGTETSTPIINAESQKLNFTNEGGVCGTFRLLKNIMGLWLLQRCRQDWQAEGKNYGYSELAETARSSQPFRSLVDPDDPLFLHPENMPAAVHQFCARTDQAIPESPAAIIRTIMESLALKYRFVLDHLEQLTGKTYREIHIVGGGAKNALLNQFTAEATGRRVVAGPVEATALGNIGMQMVATKAAGSLEEIRDVIATSFPPQIFEPREHNDWEKTYARFKTYCRATMIQS